MRSEVRAVILPILFLFIWSAASAQEPVSQPPDDPATAAVAAGQPEPQFGRRRREKTPQEIEMERRQAKALNKQRHEELKQSTDKLLELSEQLKEYVDKTDENMLSLDVIKKAEEIEKLAKRVREKMKGYYGPPIKP
ncbi:MAG TPA: hypothetical protein VLE48_10075 [Terriglobales bacterium]|nr:hypothetical protein [Terriglobales bacterium]